MSVQLFSCGAYDYELWQIYVYFWKSLLWNHYLQGAYYGWRLSPNNCAAHNIWNLMLPQCFCWLSVCDRAQAKVLMQVWFWVLLLLFLFCFFSFLKHEWFHCRDLSKIYFLCWYISDFILGIWVRFAFYIDTHHLYSVYNFLMCSGTWTPFNPETVRLMIGKNCVDCNEHFSFAKEVEHYANFCKI